MEEGKKKKGDDEETIDEAEEKEEMEEETEVFEVSIGGKTYFTTNSQSGEIYESVDGDVGDECGKFVKGVARFNA
jgi:hypothetical protein